MDGEELGSGLAVSSGLGHSGLAVSSGLGRPALPAPNLGWQTGSYEESPMVDDVDGVVLSLYQQVLFLLVSLVSAGNFPLEALALLPTVLRRKVILLLPIVDLHRLERHSPVATEGISMASIWEQVFAERLCQQTKWLTEPNTLKFRIEGERCYLEVAGRGSLSTMDLRRIVFAVPFKEDLAMGEVRGHNQIKGEICVWSCKDCKQYQFYCSPTYFHLFQSEQRHYYGMIYLTPTFLKTITILLEIFPLEIDALFLGMPSALPSVDIAGDEFRHLLSHIHTLEISLQDRGYSGYEEQFTSESVHTFLNSLLALLVSNSDSALQNLHLNMYCSSHSKNMMKYYNMVIIAVYLVFSPESHRSNVVPFLSLKKLKITTKLLKSAEITKLVPIINHQEQLEVLDISSKTDCRRYPNPAHNDLFKAAANCFHRPSFQCLNLRRFYVSTTAILDIEHHFLTSTVHGKQQLVLQDSKIFSSGERRKMSYDSENAACAKSLSIIGCTVTDVGLFSIADIASGTLSHPGDKYVQMSTCLDHMDFHKLAAAVVKGAGTLKLLDLSGSNLSCVIVRAGPLFDAIFHLPHLSELELVLKNCRMKGKDLDELFSVWEKESCGRKLRTRSCGQSLKKLCVCGNTLPKDKSNLKMMARSIC